MQTRRALSCWVAGGVLAITLVARPALAATYYVRAGGNDQADGQTAASAFKTILRAAQALDHGDKVVVGPGVYREAAFIGDRFSADGAAMEFSGDESGRQTGDQPGAVVVEAADPTQPAISFFRFKNLVVSGFTFRGAGTGLSLRKCRDVTVTRCSFIRMAQGLAVVDTSGLRVESSVFSKCTTGLFLQRAVNARLAHLTVTESSSAGILALACGAGTIRNSILAGNNSSLIGDDVSAAGWTSDDNVIHGTAGAWGQVPVVAQVYEWAAMSGQDRHSVYVVPSFADPEKSDMHVLPAVGWAGGLPGAQVGRELEPRVTVDRDGKPFRVSNGAVSCGAYDYPDPQAAAGWSRLPVKIESAAPRQSAAVYREDGTLLRTLLADATGVRELWWDGLTDDGQPVPAGSYQVRSVNHDVRVVDEGTMGDNGSALGVYNCDNADRVVVLPGGGFMISTIYDEAGFALRGYSSSGLPIFGVNLAEKDVNAMALQGDSIYATLGAGKAVRLQRLTLQGNRTVMANGAEAYPVTTEAETNAVCQGVAVAGGDAYVALGGLDVIRVINLANGAKKQDLPVAGLGDLAADDQGVVWAVSGKEIMSLAGGKRYNTGLESPRYLAAGTGKFAVVDRRAGRIALLNAADGRLIKTLGQARPAGEWVAAAPDLFRDPRGVAFLPDGRLIVTEHASLRVLWPESGKVSIEALSNFMDTAVVHPTKPEYVYCSPGVFQVDPKSGAWSWVGESPGGLGPPDANGNPTSLAWASPHGAVVLGGRPFIFYYNFNGRGWLRLADVSDPLRPREALVFTNSPAIFNPWAYATVSFSKGGDIVGGGNYNLAFNRVKFKGLDGQNNPVFDFAAAEKVGPEQDPIPARGMKSIAAISCDQLTGDLYYLAVSTNFCKMVPAWGADGTGVGRSAPDGKPLWFALSSGGNYQSLSTVNDGQNTFVMAGKSFGGQIDVFDADGLRLTTGNWGWPGNYQFGFIDLRYGVNGYLRPDGKVGAYVEDDSIGRFGRCRIDGAETIRKAAAPFAWEKPGAAGGELPDAHSVGGKPLVQRLIIPKVAPLKVDGDWAAWAAAGIVPQVVSLPTIGWGSNKPDDLLHTFRAGVSLGAFAHDGANFYVYFLCADDTPHFDATDGGRMWMFDSVELWMEEEQFGLGLLKDGTPALFKYRYHNLKGQEWSANYPLPRENVWATRYDDLSQHPLAARLANATGASFQGKKGYAVMGKIPFPEVKLVGGIAGRGGKDVLDMTGQPGEIVRIGIAFDGITAWGREQDFKVYWPGAVMFSDPTRSTPFALGE